MYEYKFIKIRLTAVWRKPDADYHKVILEEAAKGWELVQIFAPPVSAYGVSRFFDIIFKKKIDESKLKENNQ